MTRREAAFAGGVLALGVFMTATPRALAAEATEGCRSRSVCDSRPAEYIGGHALATGLLAVAAVVTDNAFDPKLPRVTPGNRELEAAANGVLGLELTLPLAAYLATMRTPEIGDASLSYAQSVLLAMTLNHPLRRARLHSSALVGFSAAVTSSFLLEQRRPPDEWGGYGDARPSVDVRVRGIFWGLQLSLASANAILAVRSERSSWLGAGVGSVLGVGIGLLTEVVHRERLEGPKPSFLAVHDKKDARLVWATNLTLLALGLGLPWLPSSPADDPVLRYTIGPAALGPGAAGAALQGAF